MEGGGGGGGGRGCSVGSTDGGNGTGETGAVYQRHTSCELHAGSCDSHLLHHMIVMYYIV